MLTIQSIATYSNLFKELIDLEKQNLQYAFIIPLFFLPVVFYLLALIVFLIEIIFYLIFGFD